MTRKSAEQNKKARVTGLPLYIAVLLFSALLFVCTVLWVQNSNNASEQMVNLLGEFYLEEITERNANTITSKIESKTEQISRAVDELDAEHLKDERSVREYISLVQNLNGLDIFALADENGMVYTSDSTFSGISRFGFLSEEINDTAVYSIKSFGTKTMLAIAIPVRHLETDGIHIVSCFTAINVESIISAQQLQNEENRIFCRMFDREGNNLLNIKGDYPDGQNLFDVYEKSAEFAPGYSLEKMRDDWENGQEGYCVYSIEPTGATYVYYKSIPGTDWMITSLMRENNINKVVESGSRNMVRSGVIMILSVSVAIVVFIVYIMAASQKVRRIRSDSEQLKIVGALSNDYSDIFLMDPLHNRSSTIKGHGQMHTAWNSEFRPYDESWEQYIDTFVFPEDAENVRDNINAENISERMKDTEEYSFDFRAVYDDGLHYVQVKFVRLFGETDRLIVGFRNIDEQMKAEAERRKTLQDALDAAQHASRAKTVFLNNMSHDIRTPMNAIIGYTSLAAAHADNREQVCDYLKKIQISGSHLLSLINDVLDMSRIESGKFRIDEKEVHLPDVIHDLRSIVQADINSKQLEFYIDTLDVVNEDVICDKLRLNQILLNILSNAIKFTKPGGTVSLRIIQTADAPKDYAGYEFRVKDNGIGA